MSMENVVKIEYTIEASWTHQSYTDTTEIDADELEGLTGQQRHDRIDQFVAGEVDNIVSWGWHEVTTGDDGLLLNGQTPDEAYRDEKGADQ
jgi:hypothetical protein